MNWYLLQTKPNKHQIAFSHLERQNFEIFSPLVIKTTKKGIKFVTLLKPLFPSYLFIGTEMDTIPWKSINATRGVSKLVTLDGKHRPLDKKIIEGIRCRCDQNGILQRVDTIKPGDLIKIERGPFADFICSVDRISDKERAWVLINILQQKIRTTVALRAVSVLD